MEIQGLIQKKDEKAGSGPKGDWKRCAYTIGEKVYATFDEALMKFSVGDTVTGEFEKSGNYSNLVSLELADKVPVQKFGVEKGKKKYLVTVEEITE